MAVQRFMRVVCVVIFNVFFVFSYCFSQITNKDTTVQITTATNSLHLNLGGFLDDENSLTIHPYKKSFEVLNSIVLSNTGNTVIINPTIIFNGRGKWYSIKSLRNEIFSGAATDKEKALSIWMFNVNNRVHRTEPEPGQEDNDPMKLLCVYGYGMCYNSNYGMCFQEQNYGIGRYFSLCSGLHLVPDLKIGTTSWLMDTDLETFYLKSDNTTIANKSTVSLDRNLIRRTHNYGKGAIFNPSTDYYVANLYNDEAPTNPGTWKTFQTLNYSLRPGESLTFGYGPGILFHTYQKICNATPDEIGNGSFNYKTNFHNGNLPDLLTAYTNISRSDNPIFPTVHAATTGSPSSFVIKVTSPFVIVKGWLKSYCRSNSLSDSVQIYFSKDSLNWTKIYSSNQTGHFSDSINLDTNILALTSRALYKYFLRFSFSPVASVYACGLDSIDIHSDFQVSRFFLPRMKSGDNLIEYKDTLTSSRNLKLDIHWKESTMNRPPDRIMNPLFPLNGASVDSLKFTFHWDVPPDADGDTIINYEFVLSERPDMKFPLSPNFYVYTKSFNGNSNPQLTIPYSGLLNHNTTYYWHVRSLDNKNTWSEWSPTWSFTPHGPGVPLNVTSQTDTLGLRISWIQNPVGMQPIAYEVHGRDESNGFTPVASTLLATTASNQWLIPNSSVNPKTFYRIIAVAATGDKSGPSDELRIPYPYNYIQPNTVSANSAYTYQIATNKMWKTKINTANLGTITLNDTVNISINYLPGWLTYNSTLNTVSGTASIQQSFRMLYDTSLTTFQFHAAGTPSGLFQDQTIRLKTDYVNYAPQLGISNDSVYYVNQMVSKKLLISDPDVPNGDSLTPSVLSKPSWLNAVFFNDSVKLTGLPLPENIGDTNVILKVTDRLGLSHIRTYPLLIRCADASIEGDSTVCIGTTATLNTTLKGHLPLSLHYSNGSDSGTVSNILSYTLPVIVSPGVSGAYKITRIDGSGCISIPTADSVMISLHQNHTPVITSTPAPTVSEDSTFLFSITTLDPDNMFCGDIVNIDAGILPSWLVFDSVNTTISGIPEGADVGDNVFSIIVSDNLGADTTFIFHINVIHLNHSPAITSIPVLTATEDSPYSYIVTSGDIDFPLFNDEVHYQLINPPAWLSIDSTSGIISGTPSLSDLPGSFVIAEAHDDHGGSATQTFYISITHVNHNPVITSIPVLTATEDSPYSYTVTSGDIDFPLFSDEVYYQLVNPPAWLSMDSTSGIISGTPSLSDLPGSTVVAEAHDDHGGSATQAFYISITHVNHNPVITSIPVLTATEDSPYSYTVTSGDIDFPLFNDEVYYQLVNSPAWLSIDSISGIITGIPFLPDLPGSTVVAEAHDDHGGSATQSFYVSISHVNHNPVIVSLPVTIVLENSEYYYAVNATDKDRPTFPDSLRFSINAGPSWVSIDPFSGLLTGIPSIVNVGDSILEIEVVDNEGGLDRQRFMLKVQNINEGPRIISKPVKKANENLIYEYHVVAVDKDILIGDELTYSLLANPSWLEINPSTGEISGLVPKGALNGENLVSIQVSDKKGAITKQEYKIEVEGSSSPVSIFPNPFRKTTTLSWYGQNNANIHIEIANAFGERVGLIDKQQSENSYQQIEWDASLMSSGIYFVSIAITDLASGNVEYSRHKIVLRK